MDDMDIDQVCDVLDTPDRLGAQDINGRECIEIESDTASGITDFSDEGSINQLRARSKPVLDNGHQKDPFFPHERNRSVSKNSEGDGDFKGKALFTLQSPISGENGVEDLMERRGPAKVFHNDVPIAILEDCCQDKEFRKGSIPTNGLSSLRGISNSSATAVNTRRGKEKVNDTYKGGSYLDRGKGTVGDSLPKVGKSVSSSFSSTPSPRAGEQIRFVRDGCISPHNIAKAKQFAENHNQGSTDLVNDRETSSTFSLNLVRDLITEGNNVSRRATFHPSSNEPNARAIDLATRSSITRNEEICGSSNAGGDAVRCFEGFSGWRNTRNRTKKTNTPLPDEFRRLLRNKADSSYVNQQNGNRAMKRESEKGISSRINEYREDQNAVSLLNGSALTEDQAVPRPISESVLFGGRHDAANALMKRQKQGSTSSNHGQSSTSNSVDCENLFLSSSKEPLNSRSTGNQMDNGPHILDPDHPVIELDEFSPEVRHFGPPNRGASSNDDSDDRARQLEADEMLARELQEQLYNEWAGVGNDEVDALISSAWQRADPSHHSYSAGSHPVFDPSGSIIPSSHRQSQSAFSQNPPPVSRARGPASARLTRSRYRLLRQLPRRESDSNLDSDMRMHILEALEAFSDMEMTSNLLQLQVEREFNENDYELLLALDENNHQHGASIDQINSLPQSTVQGDNLEEACAVCLENPMSGDTIRHLPCLHKFHKDCIDPWLTRKTTCPICKSSIT